ncbi:MAG TPA: cytochrome c biogenesis CcdA family protein [Thermoclostridium caenicola]|uniref:cytochrome c biogenesis CcdA family protein n=1 Tax=Thermoclostridium caenicola TaxID=659425 RepID=UPI002B5D3919|nr:cytochrome c biogenesis CcdA family protein [Thermoclostridium caenicola]HOL84352.1 cytochrome c biogenesis CcdA family protein [Thermoclostridium caenicola]HPO76360.1 cytochrome c biogenesis CcdA family protein [Thermoclostridium caenicola]
MDYILALIEGIVTFVSPCLLPMLPIYVSYFAGGQDSKRRTMLGALGFVLGFTLVFVSLGAFAGSVGHLLREYALAINLVTGAVVVLFGLNYLGLLRLPLLNKVSGIGSTPKNPGFFSSILFGMIFSISWTPCVGTFLGSALMLAANSRNAAKGILMLLLYSLGLGIPFIISAWLLDRLKGTFDFLRRHHGTINTVSGLLLVLVGLAMMTGMLNRLLAYLSLQ